MRRAPEGVSSSERRVEVRPALALARASAAVPGAPARRAARRLLPGWNYT